MKTRDRIQSIGCADDPRQASVTTTGPAAKDLGSFRLSLKLKPRIRAHV